MRGCKKEGGRKGGKETLNGGKEVMGNNVSFEIINQNEIRKRGKGEGGKEGRKGRNQ